jgi:DNA-binding NarL/FixJ family response regulator
MKCYIVEDSALIRGRTKYMLSKINGVDIAGASGYVDDAIMEIKEKKPDIVILDIRLNGGNGIDVLKKIKEEKPDTTVIVFTNYMYPEYISRCKELNADYFYDKSSDFNKLFELISEKAQNA